MRFFFLFVFKLKKLKNYSDLPNDSYTKFENVTRQEKKQLHQDEEMRILRTHKECSCRKKNVLFSNKTRPVLNTPNKSIYHFDLTMQSGSFER